MDLLSAVVAFAANPSRRGGFRLRSDLVVLNPSETHAES